MNAAEAPAKVPLCVDLDGTLLRGDLLWESLALLLRDKPWLVFALPVWLMAGRAALKRRILQHVRVPVESLPYNAELVEWLRLEKASGRPIILATASDQTLADSLARHLDLFDGVLGSDGVTNLKGSDKLAELRARYGANFDYVGNSSADLAIWKACREAILVDTPAHVERTARQTAVVSRVFSSPRSTVDLIRRELRLHQWLKNLLVFVPLITSHQFNHLEMVWQACVAFFAFGLMASSAYIINDVSDLQSDRKHHRKRNRPFASGELGLPWAFALAPGLFLMSVGLTAVFIPSAMWVLFAYYALTLWYSFALKTRLLVDVFTLAALYTIRMLFGASANHIEPSVWLLSFSMFIFLSLGFAKRAAELSNLSNSGATRNIRRAYVTGDLAEVKVFGIAAGYASSLVLTLYMNSDTMRSLYRNSNFLWLLFPLLLYWISRIWILTSRGEMDEDPVLFAVKDRITMLVVLCFIIIMFLATRSWFHIF
jgi:4-hydroxybenzoate polyprenyltransferase